MIGIPCKGLFWNLEVKISVCCFSSSDSRWVEGGMLCSLAKRSRRSSDYSSITRHVVSIQTMRFPWEHFDMQLNYMLVPPWKISWWNVFRGMLKKLATSGNGKEEWRFFASLRTTLFFEVPVSANIALIDLFHSREWSRQMGDRVSWPPYCGILSPK